MLIVTFLVLSKRGGLRGDKVHQSGTTCFEQSEKPVYTRLHFKLLILIQLNFFNALCSSSATFTTFTVFNVSISAVQVAFLNSNPLISNISALKNIDQLPENPLKGFRKLFIIGFLRLAILF